MVLKKGALCASQKLNYDCGTTAKLLRLAPHIKSSQTFKRRARPNARRRRAARRRQPDSLVDKACLGARVVSDMGQIPQDVLKKRNRPNARQRRRRRAARSPVEDMAVCAPDRVVICVVSLQKRLGLTANPPSLQ